MGRKLFGSVGYVRGKTQLTYKNSVSLAYSSCVPLFSRYGSLYKIKSYVKNQTKTDRHGWGLVCIDKKEQMCQTIEADTTRWAIQNPAA
jgi:hypothetical protein